MAGYSRKITSVSELKNGATIAIPMTRQTLAARCLLQKEKLITLKPDVGLLPTALDITANPGSENHGAGRGAAAARAG
jgi:D-methionine transport system substrate-binding protein